MVPTENDVVLALPGQRLATAIAAFEALNGDVLYPAVWSVLAGEAKRRDGGEPPMLMRIPRAQFARLPIGLRAILALR